ncbi:hypothetical protein IWZ03DRAFT_379345 [Phyllosticta citriasiana]|uniref:Uncharacterized protein n=1 Tax=Phyllosticta citriasiana TaxID=595635 RepID=A0ABR1KI23_9PEZI
MLVWMLFEPVQSPSSLYQFPPLLDMACTASLRRLRFSLAAIAQTSTKLQRNQWSQSLERRLAESQKLGRLAEHGVFHVCSEAHSWISHNQGMLGNRYRGRILGFPVWSKGLDMSPDLANPDGSLSNATKSFRLAGLSVASSLNGRALDPDSFVSLDESVWRWNISFSDGQLAAAERRPCHWRARLPVFFCASFSVRLSEKRLQTSAERACVEMIDWYTSLRSEQRAVAQTHA